jgi:hypothetical protein
MDLNSSSFDDSKDENPMQEETQLIDRALTRKHGIFVHKSRGDLNALVSQGFRFTAISYDICGVIN